MNHFTPLNAFSRVYVNTVDALVPEWWALMSLAVLESTMTIGARVHRDFENELGQYGDIVNTRKPASFQATRKGPNDNVTVQNAVLNNIQVPLDQQVHVSFELKDSEISKSKKDLVEEFLKPAMIAQAEFLDAVIHGQYARFIRKDMGGALEGMTAANAHDFLLDAREIMNIDKAPLSGRSLHVPPRMETSLLKDTNFLTADKVGDEGSALREASLGRKLGFDIFMGQNAASVRGAFTNRVFQSNTAGVPLSLGATVIAVDTGAGAITVGTWVEILGKPYQVAAVIGAAPTTSITLAVGLFDVVPDNTPITVYTPGAVNQPVAVTGYAAGYDKLIAFDSFTGATPVKGQMVTFGIHSGTQIYTVINATATTIELDRPLAAAIADNAAVNIAPPGDYGLAHTRNALAFVSRPLAMPPEGVGALSGIAVHNGFAMRATLTYNGLSQGLLVTLDALIGVALLDQDLGVVLLG